MHTHIFIQKQLFKKETINLKEKGEGSMGVIRAKTEK